MGHRLKLTIVLAEYNRPAPDVTQYRECWPEADIQVFSGSDLVDTRHERYDLLDPKHPRYGWRMNDLYKVRKCLDSGADVAMCFDADMRIVDREAARTLPLLAQRFGICLPINPRYMVKVDGLVGADTNWAPDTRDHRHDLSDGCGPSLNCSPIAFDARRSIDELRGFELAEAYCAEMKYDPVRGPLAWWRAMWRTGISPLILPPQWCVCERHIGCGNEIILHEGHTSVKRHYAGMETR